MEIFLGFVIIIILFDIEEKLKKLQAKVKQNHLDIGNYLNKQLFVSIYFQGKIALKICYKR